MGKKRILVTGSNGLLGQKLVHQLRDHTDFDLIATSRGENRIAEQDGYNYQSLDITDPEAVNTILMKFAPHVVINTAAMTNVDACEDNREGCWNLNVNAVHYLVDACKALDAHFIHISTDFVFDGENGPYAEEDEPNPVSYYGESKLAAEELVKSSGLNKWAIARTIIIYGIVDDMSRSNVVLWAKGAMEKGNPINVVDDQFRSPTLAEDLAAGCILIAEKEANGLYHLSGKETMSILELVYKVGEFFNLDTSIIKPIRSATLNQAAKRPPKTGFIIDKAIMELGYQPKSFTEGLKILGRQLERNAERSNH